MRGRNLSETHSWRGIAAARVGHERRPGSGNGLHHRQNKPANRSLAWVRIRTNGSHLPHSAQSEGGKYGGIFGEVGKRLSETGDQYPVTSGLPRSVVLPIPEYRDGHSVETCPFLGSMAQRIPRATCSSCAHKGALGFTNPRVIGVPTRPGFTVQTSTPSEGRRRRKPSRPLG